MYKKNNTFFQYLLINNNNNNNREKKQNLQSIELFKRCDTNIAENIPRYFLNDLLNGFDQFLN